MFRLQNERLSRTEKIGSHLFGGLLKIVVDGVYRQIHNIPLGPIVVIDGINVAVWMILFKLMDIINFGTPKRINSLRVIADHQQMMVALIQQFNDFVLKPVDVLILIHQNIRILAADFFTDIWEVA